MTNISRILVPTDFSEPAMKAFQFALLYADRAGASIELLHVVVPQSEGMDIPMISARATQEKVGVARKLVGLFAEQGIEKVVDKISGQPEIVSSVEIGFPVNVISYVAKRDDIPLIIMATKGEHNSMEKLFGSVASGVIKHATCDILVVPENSLPEKINSVAYATNLEDADPTHIARISRLLQPFKPTIHCVHLNPGHIVKDADKMMSIRKQTMELIPDAKLRFHDLLGEDLIGALNNFAEDNQVDLMIMYKPHRNFLEKLMHKSNTMSMVFYTTSPLMVIKDS